MTALCSMEDENMVSRLQNPFKITLRLSVTFG